MYKNILIITNTRDDLGSDVSFYKDITDIDPDYQPMILACLQGKHYMNGDLWSSDYMCGSDRGYIFNQGKLPLPLTVENIVHYVF